MGIGVSRVTVVENTMNRKVKLVVTRSPTDNVVTEIVIGAGEHVVIGATEFDYSEDNPGVHTTIWVYLDGSERPTTLFEPRHCIRYGKIIITQGTNEAAVKISGVRAGWMDLGRVRCLGFIAGRKYDGNRAQHYISG